MKSEPINTDRVIILLQDEDGWIAAKGKPKALYSDNLSTFEGYHITPSLWHQVYVSNEAVNKIIKEIPTDQELDADNFDRNKRPIKINLFW